MPGRRCYQRERTQHAAEAANRQRHLHDLLTAQLLLIAPWSAASASSPTSTTSASGNATAARSTGA